MNFDTYGNLVPESHESVVKIREQLTESVPPRPANLKVYHFKRLSMVRKFWGNLGTDVRFHLSAVAGCVVCFSVVFFPSLYFDDRIEIIESRALVDNDLLDKSRFWQYKREKYGYGWDVARDFQS